ncbi:hypothetical protein EJ03DRAFT_352303 [Teratosphaeria nubilosa]|uniref:Uncharacterized protein n=1 Tax=Teratosphaeria nubilosa TaxID=161662 RepID=A0A6G1L710_9PEZI|nr:hypothetical protein EJ03DRAFT_352303 [Teratosphaeria nubilosa]
MYDTWEKAEEHFVRCEAMVKRLNKARKKEGHQELTLGLLHGGTYGAKRSDISKPGNILFARRGKFKTAAYPEDGNEPSVEMDNLSIVVFSDVESLMAISHHMEGGLLKMIALRNQQASGSVRRISLTDWNPRWTEVDQRYNQYFYDNVRFANCIELCVTKLINNDFMFSRVEDAEFNSLSLIRGYTLYDYLMKSFGDKEYDGSSVVIFCKTKKEIKQVHAFLMDHGVAPEMVGELHADVNINHEKPKGAGSRSKFGYYDFNDPTKPVRILLCSGVAKNIEFPTNPRVLIMGVQSFHH